MNRYAEHLYVIPEDDSDRQLADGFVLHDQVKSARIQVVTPAGGWREVLKVFQVEYIRRLREGSLCHVLMLIDFDGDYSNRRAQFDQEIPAELKRRVFVVGSGQTPEDLRKSMGKGFEQIGRDLADDCFTGAQTSWNHPQLIHNEPDRLQMVASIRKFIF